MEKNIIFKAFTWNMFSVMVNIMQICLMDFIVAINTDPISIHQMHLKVKLIRNLHL